MLFLKCKVWIGLKRILENVLTAIKNFASLALLQKNFNVRNAKKDIFVLTAFQPGFKMLHTVKMDFVEKWENWFDLDQRTVSLLFMIGLQGNK